MNVKKLAVHFAGIATIASILGLAFSNIAEAVTYTNQYEYNQSITAHAYTSGSIMASGQTSFSGAAACHPLNYGSTYPPLYNWGTAIVFDQSMQSATSGAQNGGAYVWLIYDVGDVNNTRGLTRYWVDLYFGPSPQYTTAANNFGLQYWNYEARIPS